MVNMVAHRGWSARYPENSLKAIAATIDIGGCWIEFDVQLSGDEVPMLFHDAALYRSTGFKGDIFDHSATGLTKMPLKQPLPESQNEKQYITRLSDALELLAANPHVTYFVEIKDESLRVFDIEHTVDVLLAVMEPYKKQIVIIAYNWQALAAVRQRCQFPVGWILEAFDAESRSLAEKQKPEYLICNHQKLDSKPWPGPWQWMLYEINDPAMALHYSSLGIDFIETSDIAHMLPAGDNAK